MRTLLAGMILVGLLDVVHADDGLDRTSISEGVAKIKARVMGCASQATTGGTVKVTVRVAPDGSVASATPNAADVALGACVAGVLKTATFAPSTNGGSFSYPFVFGAPAGKTGSGGSGTNPSAPQMPQLDRVAITTGIDSIKTQVALCGAKLTTTTKLTMRVTVAPAGHVTSVEPEGDKAAGKCVADAIMSINFGATASGGSFTYPFILGPTSVGASSSSPVPDKPGALGAAQVQDGIDSVRAQLQTCSDASSKTTGSVQLELTIANDGRVTGATVNGTTVTSLRTCLVKAAKTMRVPASTGGGTFIVPLTLGKSVADGEPVALLDGLDRASITAGMSSIDAKVDACRAKHAKVSGVVKLEIRVDGTGRVTRVADKDGDKAPVACLTAAVKTITFARTVNGGSFTYPFAFGSAALAENLDRALIADGVAKVKSAVSACGTASTKGTVKVNVVVAASGAVTSVVVDRTPDPALGACVAAAIQKATFKPTKLGGSFSYPFVF